MKKAFFIDFFSKTTYNTQNERNRMNLLTLVKEKVNKAYAAQGYANANTLVKTSDRPDISDYQSNGALPLAKETKENPRAIAEKIVQELKKDSFFSDVRIDGPGFINMRIADTVLGEMPYDILSGKSCGYERKDAPRKIFIDYGGPNIAKALHVGHLRPAVIGEAIKRLCQFVGDEVIGDVHLGDFGLPMGLVATELMERKPDLPYFDPGFTGEYPKESPVTLAELGILYPLASQKSKEDPTFMAKAKENTRKFQTGDRGLGALVAHFVNVSVSEIKSLYDELDVYFDLWRGESHVLVRLQNMIERLRKNGTIIPDSGAEIIPLGKSKGGNDLPPLIMVSSDKTMMYGATDLATIEERVEEFHPDNILYVVDARQALHFEQVFSGAEKIGLGDAAKLEFL
jgi:arginyl-tRNA synthetase